MTEPGSIFKGKSIQFPSEYEGFEGIARTLAILKRDNATEWFKETKEGRRSGEKPVHVITRYDLKNDTKTSMFIPPEERVELDFEDIKEELRGHAKRKRNVGNGLDYFEIKEERK